MTSALSLLHARPRKYSPAKLNFLMFEPSADAVCPISQDAILESELEFLQGVTVLEDSPNLRGMRLPCGHEFSGMNLVYHWARNRNVLCPVCRGGPAGAHLDLRKLPQHFRAEMAKKARSERRKDKLERVQEDEEAARLISVDMTEPSLTWFYNYVIGMVNCAVVQRCTHEGREYHKGIKMPCNYRFENGVCIFTAWAPSHIIRSMDEISVIGLLGSGIEETRFPQSCWCPVDNRVEGLLDLSDPANHIHYSIVFDDHAKITFSMTLVKFREHADYHEHISAMLALGIYDAGREL